MSGTSFTLRHLADAVPALQLVRQESPAQEFQDFAFDTRRLSDGGQALFVALRGTQRDGHAFISDAYEKGVRNFLVVDAAAVPAPANVVQAADPLAALQAIAAWYRSQLPYPLIAITGSNGKTIVKEWLASVLEPAFRLGKSPSSYNSQLGVPLALLELPAQADYGVIEAGISLPGEMQRLHAMVRPEIGIMTHFGDAHAEGFASDAERLLEKLRLFQGCRHLLLSADDTRVLTAARQLDLPLRTVGRSPESDLRLLWIAPAAEGLDLTLQEVGHNAVHLHLSTTGDAALENSLLVVLAARHLGLDWAQIQRELDLLLPVSMRTEWITDNPDLSIINDTYTADRASVRNAFSLLAGARGHEGRALVLTDMEHLGPNQASVQRDVLRDAEGRFGRAHIQLIGPVFQRIAAEFPGIAAYADTQAFLSDFQYERYKGKTVLLKGARKFALERVVPHLSRRAVATWFKINMNHLSHNLRRFRAWLPPEVKLMAMVKAFSYGSGTWEIAQALEQEGVDALAVAYTSEGIALRTHGIRVPILIMNADTDSMEQLFRFRLEPEVHGLDFLRTYTRLGRNLDQGSLRVHIKVDTGMHRLGFPWDDPAPLREFLAQHPEVELASVMSHLAAADEPGLDAYTLEQVQRFESFYAGLGFSSQDGPPRHILNTAGILRFPQYAWEMVRLGIGLYGVSPLDGHDSELLEIGSLHTVITQIHHHPPGTPIGYACSETTQAEARIATIPVGYADGIRRSLSNGVGSFLVRGQRAPVVGRVCMDMLMLDVTHIPEAQAGDEVVLIGRQGKDQVTVAELARLCQTIPYEILTGISQRVRRVYVRE
jgi:Alr-MurF fusion protein